MRIEKTKKILDYLDATYGIDKKGFLHDQPWQLLVAIMLSAQSTDQQVDAVLPKLFIKYKKVEDMANADTEELEEIIKTIGLYHNKAKNMKNCCFRIFTEYQGIVPDTLEELIHLPGVGRKTANLFLADEYGIPGITVDTHVGRISNRLGWAGSNDPKQVELQLQKVLPKSHWIRINIQLIRHGRAVCKARRPLCGTCGLRGYCDFTDTGK